jgi:hypothetical protein
MWTLANQVLHPFSPLSLFSFHITAVASMETGGGFHGYRKLPNATPAGNNLTI